MDLAQSEFMEVELSQKFEVLEQTRGSVPWSAFFRWNPGAGATTANTRLVTTCRPPVSAALPRAGPGGPSFFRGLGFPGRLVRLRGRNLLSFLLDVVLESNAFVLMFLLAACRLWSSKGSLGSGGRASEIFRRWADEAKLTRVKANWPGLVPFYVTRQNQPGSHSRSAPNHAGP
jgi:hypothetical protein